MFVATLTSFLDWLGIIAFAVSGAVVASRKQMDIVGFAILGTVTGIGGGTLRDLLLGSGPVFWVREPAYLLACIAVASAIFFLPRIPDKGHRVLQWLDALGLALFAVTGAERALLAGAGPIVAVVMGIITASFGGIIRDVLGNESPTVLSSEVYVTAAAMGAGAFVILESIGAGRDLAIIGALAIGFGLRVIAITRSWSLPTAS
jgi:uncharacterized membrane protein YeiH